jgi:hypothetical protein
MCHSVTSSDTLVTVDTTPPKASAPGVTFVDVGALVRIPQLATVGDFSDVTVSTVFNGQRVAQVLQHHVAYVIYTFMGECPAAICCTRTNRK